jgi:hypothetical protein
MFYDVKYKLIGQFFFRSLKKVKGDGINDVGQSRWFILADETRVEIPCSAQFIFSTDRFEVIRKGMEKEAGQKLPID